MINISNKKNCCGCTACESVCAHNAITMVPDSLGFKYPVIDHDKCTSCGICEKVCSFNENYKDKFNHISPLAYGVRHKNIKEVETSRSGAAFIAFSDWVLDQGGIVYGVGYKDHFRVAHKRATSKEERNEFKGSKYVQSDLSDIFIQVKNDLKEGRLVLFSGTPCQTAGLNSFIGNKYQENLILIDIICHGVPSPYIWRDYIKYYELKYNQEIVSVDFRNKDDFGWNNHRESFTLENGQKISPKENIFTSLFVKHVMLRPSCGNCYYCNMNRPSDITIGDFWGWEKSNNELNIDDKGLSLVIINTERGKNLFNDISSNLHYFTSKIEDCLQPNLIKPSQLSPLSDKFEELYRKFGFSYVAIKFTKTSIYKRVKYRVKNKIKKIINNL